MLEGKDIENYKPEVIIAVGVFLKMSKTKNLLMGIGGYFKYGHCMYKGMKYNGIFKKW